MYNFLLEALRVGLMVSFCSVLATAGIAEQTANEVIDKQKIVNEFKNKLLNDEEFQKVLQNDNTISIEDDLNKLLNVEEKSENSSKQKDKAYNRNKELYDIANSTIGDGEEQPKKKDVILEELKKMEEEYGDGEVETEKNSKQEKTKPIKNQKEQLKEIRKEEKKEEEKKNIKSDSQKTSVINLNGLNNKIKDLTSNSSKDNATPQMSAEPKIVEVLTNDFPITDTGVSYEYLYTKEYLELLKSNTSIEKPNPEEIEQPPLVEPLEKQLVSFDTADIPKEILAYERSEKNLHIPTVILIDDTREIAAQAIEQNNLPVLRGVLEKVKDPDFILMNGQTLINYAAEFGQEMLIRYLIYSGANLNIQDHNGNTALHNAILKSNTNVIKVLVSNGASLDILNNDGNTALMLSIVRRMVPVALYLLQYPADITITNENGDSALTLSRKYRLMQVQQILLNKIREKTLTEEGKVNLINE